MSSMSKSSEVEIVPQTRSLAALYVLATLLNIAALPTFLVGSVFHLRSVRFIGGLFLALWATAYLVLYIAVRARLSATGQSRNVRWEIRPSPARFRRSMRAFH